MFFVDGESIHHLSFMVLSDIVGRGVWSRWSISSYLGVRGVVSEIMLLPTSYLVRDFCLNSKKISIQKKKCTPKIFKT